MRLNPFRREDAILLPRVGFDPATFRKIASQDRQELPPVNPVSPVPSFVFSRVLFCCVLGSVLLVYHLLVRVLFGLDDFRC